MDLSDNHQYQPDLLNHGRDLVVTDPMMAITDTINQRFGRNTLKPASSYCRDGRWLMKQARLSPRYTTCWEDILKVKC